MSPAEIEILLHYWYSTEPHPELATNSYTRDSCRSFYHHGLLELVGNKYVGVKDALEPYIEALKAVPLPVKVERWEIPTS